jgi:hypothetical protein
MTVPARFREASMTVFHSQRQGSQGSHDTHRRGRGFAATLLVQILALLALGGAIAGYLEWSSETNQVEFVGRRGQLVFDPDQFPQPSVPVHAVKGQTACYRKAPLTGR